MPAGQKQYIFLVQGEGRGHMTQAIGLRQILVAAGHTVSHVFIGKSKRRIVPPYFFEAFDTPVEALESPNFISDPENKAIRLLPSIGYNLKYLNRFRKSLKRIHEVVMEKRPDAIINFYDFLGGFYHYIYKPSARFFAIGHQFLAEHPDFPFAEGKPLDKQLFLANNRLNSLGAYKKIALSFRPYHPGRVGNMVVTPPILRKEIFDRSVTRGDFLLGYMVNDGYSQEIIRWHQDHPEIAMHCFWDKKEEPDVKKIHRTLTFHQLNADKFMDFMSACRGLMTTAGFESVCEAMLLDKPVLMVPVSGQYEQACNAIDASLAGAGISDHFFNISGFLDYLPVHKSTRKEFRLWSSSAAEMILKELTDF